MKSIFSSTLYILLLLLTNCTNSQEDQFCSFTIENLSNVCIALDNEAEFGGQEPLIEKLVRETISKIDSKMPINNLELQFINNNNLIIPELNLGGFNPSANKVIIAINPRVANLELVLEQGLPLILAHEVHHAIRRRSVGYGDTLLEAVISEGLADHFAIEITNNDPPPWSIALENGDLKDWISLAKENWHDRPYNHEAWFFGQNSSIPRWAGYSIGYYLVNHYLEQYPERKPSNLHDEVAENFVPE